jgi:thiamine-monophosphate kinase
VAGPDQSPEERLIAQHFRPLATHPGAFGLADDAAVLSVPEGFDLVVTTDGVIAGVHFFFDDAPADIARKALRMNLSDLAAKGAKPLGFVMAVALPESTDDAWLAAFAAGLGEDAGRYGCPLLGGDTDHTPGLMSISITAFGAVPQSRMVRRSGARVGDSVLVTGTIGDAALGLRLRGDRNLASRWRLTEAMAGHLLGRYLRPEPRTTLAEAVLSFASSAMDVSDGLAGDLGKLCRASSLAADVDVAQVPLSDAAHTAIASRPTLLETLLTGGDDYEIVLTVAQAKLQAFQAAARAARVPVTEIGRMRSGDGAQFTRQGKALVFARPAFSHF